MMNLRRESIILLSNLLFSTLALSVFAEDLTWLHGGVDSFQDCSTRGQVVRGLCGSGKNRDCNRGGHSSYSSAGCGDLPDPASSSSASGQKISAFNIQPRAGMNGWQCVKWGVNYSCPSGYVVVGVCGSGRDEDCRTYCNPWTHSAIKCAPVPGGQGVNSGQWSAAQRWGRYYQCGADEAVCGACQSGENKDCNGGHFRVKCCTVGDFDVVGRWTYMRTVVGDTTETLRRGTNKSVKETTTNAWSLSVTRSVEAGFKVKGIGASTSLSIGFSKSYANEYSEEWSSNEETEFTFQLDEKERGKALWQWVFDIADPYSNQVTSRTMDYALTEGRDAPPRCQPGFSAGLTVDYQYCTSDDRTLPGFEPLPTPTHMPSNSPTPLPSNSPIARPSSSPSASPSDPVGSFASQQNFDKSTKQTSGVVQTVPCRMI